MSEIDNKILINVEDDEARIALLRGKKLDNLYIEQTHRSQKVGNIYCGKVIKVQPSFQAAFIDYGEERHGFLSLTDINFQVYKPSREGRGRPSIAQLLKPGQKILVQVIKDEIGHKGASLTTNISLAGRFLVFMPDSDRGGVSKKIEDEDQRARLRHLLKGLGSENSSAIIRTVGVDRSLTELKRDYTILRRTWNEIKDEYEEQSTPGLLYQEEDAMLRMIRDYYNDSVTEVVIDEPASFQHALEFFKTHMPAEQKKLQLYLGEKSLFSTYDIEGQIEVLHHQQVPLPSGGSLVIMPTEALVAIDVNSGRSTQERNVEATALRTNLEAAEEVSRQLRLRNLGGLIVVDFIDMENTKNRLAVEQLIEEEMSSDKAKTSFGVISKFGLLELSRQRIASSLSLNSIEITLANRILRKIHDSAIEQKVMQVHIRLPLKLATHLLNVKRQRITQMEMDYGIRISITPDTLLGVEEIPEMEVTLKGQGGGKTRTSVPISASDMRDDKPGRKKGRAKKEQDKKEFDKKDDSVTVKSSPEKKTADKQIKSTETPQKTLPKNEVIKSAKETSLKTELPDTTAEAKKGNEESSVRDPQKTAETYKKLAEISKPSIDKAIKAEETVVLFKSSHEPVKKQPAPKNKISTPEKLTENKEEPTVTTYTSVHLEDQHNLTEKTKILAVNKTEKENAAETPMFSSVHLGDAEKKAKQFAAKQDSKAPAAAEKTLTVTEKKSVKSVVRKSTAKKPAAKKTDSSKASVKAQPKKAKVESPEKSGAKSKSAQSKVSAAKKDPVKSTTPKRAEEDKNSSSKSVKKTTKPKPKAKIPQKQKNKPVTPATAPKAEESAA
ncbi:MAG: Rne/Rng family ribonuclease [SAR324 cluster bacterium]|nr:Rne/Rng family ribonuclease [SAR324 cluster bacterium]